MAKTMTGSTSKSLPPVSVVIPFWNAEPFLAETIDSVVSQSFLDWELVLVDDGSTDGSTRIAADYVRSHPDKIRHVAHPGHKNLGQFASRALGARLSRNNLVALLDADDVWMQDYLAVHLAWRSQLLPNNGNADGLSFGPALYWQAKPVPGHRDFMQGLPAGTPGTFLPGALLDAFFEPAYALTPCTSTTMLTKGIFRKLEHWGPAASECLAFEDQLLWWYAAAYYPAAVHSECRVRYRWQASGSALARMDASPFKATLAELLFLQLTFGHLSILLPDHRLIYERLLVDRISTIASKVHDEYR